jgi:hypothetical protein
MVFCVFLCYRWDCELFSIHHDRLPFGCLIVFEDSVLLNGFSELDQILSLISWYEFVTYQQELEMQLKILNVIIKGKHLHNRSLGISKSKDGKRRET